MAENEKILPLDGNVLTAIMLGQKATQDTLALQQVSIGRLADAVASLDKGYVLVSSSLYHIQEQMKDYHGFSDRLTRLESESKSTAERVTTSGQNARWAIGLGVTTVLGIVGLVMELIVSKH